MKFSKINKKIFIVFMTNYLQILLPKLFFKQMSYMIYFLCIAFVLNSVRSENDSCIIYSYLDNNVTYANQYFSLELALQSELMNFSSMKNIALVISSQCTNLKLKAYHYKLYNTNLTIKFKYIYLFIL